MEVNGVHQLSGYRHCSAEERNSYRFDTTSGRVNYDRIFILSEIVLLSIKMAQHIFVH